MRSVRLYFEYRRQGLRRAWSLSGVGHFAQRVLVGFLVGVAIVAAAAALSSKAQAISDAADNRVAAKLSNQAALIDNLSKFLAACLGPRDGVIWIGGEAHLCRAVPMGVTR